MALFFIARHFLVCLFPSIVDDTHIIGPFFIVSFAYEHFKTELRAISFSIQLHKCVAWSPFGRTFNFSI
jgi:hypothetical protein